MTETAPFDEMHNADGSVREPYLVLDQWLKEQPAQALSLMAADADLLVEALRYFVVAPRRAAGG